MRIHRQGMGLRLDLLVLMFIISVSFLCGTVLSDLVLSKVDRRVDLRSQIVRVISTLKVENGGTNLVSEVLLAFRNKQAKHLAYLGANPTGGKGKAKDFTNSLPVQVAHPKDMPSSLTFYSVTLQKGLAKGESFTLDVLAVYSHALQPFPEKISQAELQLLVFQDSSYFLSPYAIKVQSLSIKLPDARIESYTKLDNTKIHGSEIKYGPYENLPPFSYSPIVVHYENKQPFAVAHELVRELEISHWGNVQVTEHYNLHHGGAQLKGEFSRLDYQSRPHVRGASAFRHLVAKLPPRARSAYYRDEIGNISTSHLWGDSKKTELEIEPRYPLFGGWKTAFTIGYGLPLHDFLFESQGKRFLNFTFGSPISDLVVDTLIVKVVLPEGAGDISVSTPFPVKQSNETKISHLDVAGRPVVVLEKTNVVPEHNQYFQVYYKFNSLAMFREPFMLISGFLILFLTGIVYMHADMSISKSSPSYLAKLQWDEVRAAVQQVQNIISRCITLHDKLEASLHDLSRTGDVQACKAARKAVDGSLKELTKELKPLLAPLQSSQQAAQILPKVEDLIVKEKDLQERLLAKHSTVVDCYEKKYGGKEIENRVALHQQKISVLRQEVDDLLDFIDEI
ncbi:dolichyl-diphosphooligosaccharide--protein glycosyltransferase subunit 1A-like [Humulus lupulus]|uniref:dolichyl-diphosphooligosaccharide--protein glycosyltransferase subunit 1A-like n=1 Tax=Humulus lupulus TaxID=3486 RepID=UPI002B41141B|nr:dolichyl-diphosphooligosaccharide--protein glycosyltransferase subunit 1A-like [Humulus lupulus]XP_062101133.1 dolichyl-diphosphooligosaccharide--protein glycosyltransferase subunit 1A-like [Humulus lupulus]XP_062101134.1 dolichyl-diphosphooligosaccharide--protein glycosyltransferase subunit 1A-like [Humulus lupulus]